MNTALVRQNSLLPVPVADLDSYIEAVSHIPILSADEERDLAVRLQQHNDLDAARRLIMAHLRFVVHIARGYRGYGLPLADLVQEGNIGLMKAVKRFDPNHGVRLVSFAVHWIRAEIHEFVLRNWRIVKVATTKAQRKLFFNLRGAKKQLGWLSKEEAETVAKDLGVSTDTVIEMEARLNGHDVSFEPSSDAEGQDERELHAPIAYLQAEHADPVELLEQEDWETSSNDRLTEALQRLDARSQDILKRRWLSEPKPTLHELAAEYGISAERVRQIENNAIKRLRSALE